MGFGQPSKKSSSSSMNYPKGVYVNLFTISSIEDNENNTYNQDINLIVNGTTQKHDGTESFEKKIFLSGNHLKEQGKPVDFGTRKNGTEFGSWRISHFLKSLNMDDMDSLTEDGSTLKDEVKADLCGRSFYICEYESNGDRSRNTWKFFASETQGKNHLYNQWNNQDTKWVPSDYANADSFTKVDKHQAAFDSENDDMPF